MRDTILSLLPPAHPWRQNLHWFETIDSTNTHARLLARQGAPHGTLVLAGHQSQGRGRMGRSFHSPAGQGIYLSVVLRPDCPAEALMHLTCAAGVAMCDAVEKTCGMRPGIKWINDLVLRKRKVGGILAELGFRPDGTVDYAIVGIGINCAQQAEDFPEEIASIAGSLSMVTGTPVAPEALAAQMILALSRMSETLLSRQAETLQQYRADCITLGKRVRLLGKADARGTALDVDDDGGLIVALNDGSVTIVHSGEVSVRGLYGYAD